MSSQTPDYHTIAAPFTRTDAKWIWPARLADEVNQYMEFRQEFELGETSPDSTLYISVDSEYAVWVNGKLAGFGQYHDFPADKTYDTLDISGLLKPGKNAICVLAYHQSEGSFQYVKGDAGLIYALEVGGKAFVSGDGVICRKSPAYTSGPMPKITFQLGFVFEYDAAGDDGWRDSDYCVGSDWSPIEPTDQIDASARLVNRPRPIKKLELLDRVQAVIVAQGVYVRGESEGKTVAEQMQSDFLSFRAAEQVFNGQPKPTMPCAEPVTLMPQDGPHNGGVYFVVDLGREEAGFIDLDIEAEAGTVIDLAWGEHLDDLRVRASVGGRNYAFKYTCRAGRQQFTHYFQRIAGRYLELHISGMSSPMKLHYVGLRPTEYPLELRGEYDSPDSLQRMIWDTSIRTLHLCMHEHYEDCPWREQALYAMDSRNQALAGYYGFGEYPFPQASFKLLGDSLKEDGYLELCAPLEFDITIPSFSMAWMIESAEHYLYSGNADAAKPAYERAKRMMDVYIGSMKNGLLPCPTGKRYWHFYDWADGVNGVDENTGGWDTVNQERYESPLILFFCLALKAAVELAVAAGKSEDATRYQTTLEGVRNAFHSAFWDSDRKAYLTRIGDGTKKHFAELPQALAILAGVCPDGVADRLRDMLADSNNGLVETTLSQSIYKFDALLQDPAKHAPWVFEKISKYWGYMLRNGATSFWETIKGGDDFGNAGSLCHGWSGTPVYFYAAYLLGIKPLEPGFKTFAANPITNVVPNASGKVPTPYGPIEVAWRMVDGKAVCDVKHPEETRRG